MNMKSLIWAGLALSLLCLGGCNNLKYDVGGTVTGLSGSGLSGSGLVLEDNGADNLSVTLNGTFAFGTGVKNGDVYAVTVATEPSNPTQTCTVYNGSGTIRLCDRFDDRISDASRGFPVCGERLDADRDRSRSQRPVCLHCE
jgi:hypothetical protein